METVGQREVHLLLFPKLTHSPLTSCLGTCSGAPQAALTEPFKAAAQASWVGRSQG